MKQASVDDLKTQKMQVRQVYDFKLNNLRGVTNLPAAYDIDWNWHGAISNIVSSGSVTGTDNGNFKLNGVSDSVISNVTSYYGTATT